MSCESAHTPCLTEIITAAHTKRIVTRSYSESVIDFLKTALISDVYLITKPKF